MLSNDDQNVARYLATWKNNWKVEERIGSGSFGAVYKIYCDDSKDQL